MSLSAIDVIVADVPSAVTFFRDVVGLEVVQTFDRFAELRAGDVSIMLSPDALVPVGRARGVILHVPCDDVAVAAERARAAGAVILFGPGATPFGTESVMVRGPEETVIDLFREVPEAP